MPFIDYRNNKGFLGKAILYGLVEGESENERKLL